jgi:steroid delta-isomerase-like uncharacterized protein
VALCKKLYRNFNDRDLDGNAKILGDDCKLSDLATGATYRGVKGHRDFEQNWISGFPDAKAEVVNAFGSGDSVCCEVVGSGTHKGTLKGPSGGIPATGRKVELHKVDVYRCRGGRVVEGRTYYDVAGMLHQLGIGK